MIGLSRGYDQLVLRGSTGTRSFVALYLKEDKSMAAGAINRLGDFMIAKRLTAERIPVDPVALTDDTVPLQSLVPKPVTS
jgi:3-phenylpropionate/trans-cinnamate dioxygenase ferredoxin reductase component